MNKLKFILCIFIVAFLFLFNVNADDITDTSVIQYNGGNIDKKVLDKNTNTYLNVKAGSVITISNETSISGIYIEYYRYDNFKATITSLDKSVVVGEDGFLHQYINIKNLIGNVNSVELKYEGNVLISDIYVVGEGELPEYVEIWNKPCEKADILLFSTHSDDEQLFFLGLIPTYVARNAYFQVVYFAHHNDNPVRLHEQLHGLYTVGLRNYPIIGYIPDAYSTTLDGAISNLNRSGITVDQAKNFQIEMIRRFKPQVVIGHDEAGEYSHGQHILNTHLLKQAIVDAANPEYIIESSPYEPFQISKLYLHLYKENSIVLDYDTPIQYFDGLTAYEVSKEGYKKHNSQQWTWFTGWINGKNNELTKASEIQTYSPCQFGLYFSNVGEDNLKNDVMENIEYYKRKAEREKLEQLEKEQFEQIKKDHDSKKEPEKDVSKIKFIAIAIVVFLLLIVLIILFKTKK